MKCQKCGKVIDNDSNFCEYCGERVLIDNGQFITLYIKRNSAFVGSAMPYRIIINGKEVTQLTNGNDFQIQLPKRETIDLKIHMVGNAITLHKIKKEVIIYPDNYDTKKINCIITSKLNALVTLSGGLLGAVGRLELNIYPDPKEIIKNPINYNFRNIKDMNNIIFYSTLHLKENHLFYSYIHNNFQDCEIAAKVPARQVFANAPEYAMPINFLITKGDKKTVILLVNGSKCKRYSVLETMELCKENGITPLRFIIDTGLPNEEQYVVDRIRKTLQ